MMYMYLCKDGVWRVRCGRHIPKGSPLAPTWYPGDHPGGTAPMHVENEMEGGKRVSKKTPVFYEMKGEIGCPVCRASGQ